MEFLALYIFLMVCVLVVDYFDTKDTQAVLDARHVRPVIVSDLTASQLNNALSIKKAIDSKMAIKIAAINAKNAEVN